MPDCLRREWSSRERRDIERSNGYCGSEPERVASLALIEGLGPPDSPPDSAPKRFAGWIRDLERTPARERRGRPLADAAERLRRFFPLSEEISLHLARQTLSIFVKREWRNRVYYLRPGSWLLGGYIAEN